MVAECSFLYPDGRNCRRIPRRSQTLCRDHRRRPAARLRTPTEEEAFHQQQSNAADEILRLRLDQMLHHAQECLMAIEPFIEAHAPAAERVRFMRLGTAIAAAMDCVDSQAALLSQVVPGITPDDVNAMMTLLGYARPNYGAQARALGIAAAPPAAPASISKQND